MLASNGATASASSTYTGTVASATNNGDRKGLSYGENGTWSGSSGTFPQWLQIDFNGSKTIDEIDVFTLQDNYQNPSEPTETMIFSQYGVTAFTVEYWTGTTWAAVPGGSISDNNKVWRKITFSPITTSKIRVTTTASASGWTEITEVEAWTAASTGGSSSNVKWLVADHLGTPRMIFDQTGSLANVSRHDYLPFGEELFGGPPSNPGVGGRLTTQGYTASDNLRQKFTGYERDTESGLDYAQARYYASGQGRFIEVDPLLESAQSYLPQSWNRYSYSFNNPLRYTDPDGMIPGDFYNLDGKKIGTDGVNDGMKYVVYDKKEAKQIENTTGNYTATVTGKVTVGSADIVTAIGDAVTRSDNTTFTGVLNPNETATGGFAEAGATGQHFNGGTVVTVAPNGPAADPRVDKEATISLPTNVDVKVHVHPSGEITNDPSRARMGTGQTIGGSVKRSFFDQRPSPRDVSNATAGTNIVVGAGDQTVYFYARSGNQKDCNCIAKMSLSNFKKVGK